MQLDVLSRWKMDGCHLPQPDDDWADALAVPRCAIAQHMRICGTVYGVGDLVYLHNQVYEIKVCIQVDSALDIPQMGWILEQWSFDSQPTSVGTYWRRCEMASILILDEAIQRSLRLVQAWTL